MSQFDPTQRRKDIQNDHPGQRDGTQAVHQPSFYSISHTQLKMYDLRTLADKK